MVYMKVYVFVLNSGSVAIDFCSIKLNPLCRVFDLSCSPLVPRKDRISLSVGAASLYLSSAIPTPNYHNSKLFFGVINELILIINQLDAQNLVL